MARALGRFQLLASRMEWLALAQSSTYNSRVLAQCCHVSARQLRRHFHQRFGCSPQQWLNEQRLRAACPMLDQFRSVKRVALELGFKQVSHFSREFKRFHGQTASEYLLSGSACRSCPPQTTNVRDR